MVNSNLKVYIAHKFLFLSMIIDPIFVLYLYENGLNATQLYFLTSVQTISIIILELPTGIISDVLGAKGSIILGGISMLLATLLCVFLPNFIGFLGAELFIGMYKVFCSGSDESYLYLELKKK